jgi:hypothetical protein
MLPLPRMLGSPLQQLQFSEEDLRRSLRQLSTQQRREQERIQFDGVPTISTQPNLPGLFKGHGVDSSTDVRGKQQAHRWQDAIQAGAEDGAQAQIASLGTGVTGFRTWLELQTRPRGAGELVGGLEALTSVTPAMLNPPSSRVGPRAVSFTSSIGTGMDIAGLGNSTLAEGQGGTRSDGTGDGQGMLHSTRASSGVFPDE